MKGLGGRLQQLMTEKGFTQRELAGMVGVTDSAMSRYINDEREPKAEVLANMATALNTTSDFLISGKTSSDDFAEIYRLVARSASSMTDEEKVKLAKAILGK